MGSVQYKSKCSQGVEAQSVLEGGRARCGEAAVGGEEVPVTVLAPGVVLGGPS